MIILRIPYKNRTFQFCVLAVAITSLLIWIGIQCGLSKSDWSGWVQAAGATVGIGIAILVPYKQKIDSTNAEAEKEIAEINRLKTAIKEELVGFFNSFYFPYPEYLQSRSDEMTFDILIPIYAYHFPVHGAVVGRLTLIPEHHLRTAIGDFYRLAGNLLTYARENNRLLEEIKRIEATPGYKENPELLNQRVAIYGAMPGLCSRMRAIVPELPVRARDVAERLGAEFF